MGRAADPEHFLPSQAMELIPELRSGPRPQASVGLRGDRHVRGGLVGAFYPTGMGFWDWLCAGNAREIESKVGLIARLVSGHFVQ
jgi:hypothetical protein